MFSPIKSFARFSGQTALLLAALSSISHAATIRMDEKQQQSLGIQSAALEAVQQAWGESYPAKVVVPNTQLRVVSAPLDGLLQSLAVAEGETVQKGSTLAVIHSPQLLEQQSAYLLALTDLNLAATERKRDEELARDGIIAQRRYLESNARYTQLATRLEQHRQTLKLSGMSQSEIDRLRRTRKLSPTLSVVAPLSGVVLEQMATSGSQLNALDPIYKVGHLDPLWIEIHVPLDQLGETARGVRVQVVDAAVSGEVITVGRMVHGEDQGVLIRAEVKEGAAQLRPGQFVQVRIEQSTSSRIGGYRIPRSALVRHEGKTWVFRPATNGFEAIEVKLIKEEQNALLISGGLAEQDRVVIKGTVALKAAWLEGAE